MLVINSEREIFPAEHQVVLDVRLEFSLHGEVLRFGGRTLGVSIRFAKAKGRGNVRQASNIPHCLCMFFKRLEYHSNTPITLSISEHALKTHPCHLKSACQTMQWPVRNLDSTAYSSGEPACSFTCTI